MNEFEELIKKRRVWVEANKINNFDLNSLLAGLYNDPSHFIYEILQNAEDAEAKEVRFELLEDRLDIYHNGIDFDFKDVDGVTGIGISRKKEDLNAIGKFGVGFKSVFAVTQTPIIYSGEYNLKIEDFVVPSTIKRESQVRGTRIALPFNHELRSREEIFNLVSKKLETIGLKTLLFLKNIEEIKWQTPINAGHYLKSKSYIEGIDNARRVTIVSEALTEEYLVIERPIEIEGKKLKVEVAYKIGKNKENKEIIIPEIESKLIVFFPTERPTYLNFLIQGPYKTTPNRENIPIEDEQNKLIVEETGNLVAESISLIKNLGYLDIGFISLLPISPEDKKRDQIYSIIYEKIKEKLLKENNLLPTVDGKYTGANDALLARGKELTELLNGDDIKYLFNRPNWLDKNITYDQTRALRDYVINELGIIEIDFEDFAGKITLGFLQLKSDDWIIRFYSSLLDQRALWREKTYLQKAGILRTKPIIRLENNEHVAPFDDFGIPQVYLPAESKSEYKTVKHILTETEASLRFLEELGLKKPDLYSEIKEFVLPKYHEQNISISNADYFSDFHKILTAYNEVSQEKKSELIAQFSDIYFVKSINPVTQEVMLRKAFEVYLNEPDLKEYFIGVDSIYFVVDELYKELGSKILDPFLKEIGVESRPRKIKINSTLLESDKELLRKSSDLPKKTWDKVTDYDLESLSVFLNNLSREKSLALWRIFIDAPTSYFEGTYEWTHYASYTRKKGFTAQFVKNLRQNNWLYDKEGDLKKPCELIFSDLPQEYSRSGSAIDFLVKRLEFKPEIMDQLPEEYKNKLELVKEYSIEILKMAIEEIEKRKERETLMAEAKDSEDKEAWIPKLNPEEIEVVIEETTTGSVYSLDLKGQGQSLLLSGDKSGEDPEHKEKEQDSGSPDIADKTKKQIGNWGEAFVFCTLKRMYKETVEETSFGFKARQNNDSVEIIWLNRHGNVGKGYDFVINRNSVECEYVEVKTKAHGREELIEITGTQWEFARQLFDQGEGEKYWIYVVSNAGLPEAKITRINNPIQLWKDGKLYAHPINFKL